MSKNKLRKLPDKNNGRTPSEGNFKLSQKEKREIGSSDRRKKPRQKLICPAIQPATLLMNDDSNLHINGSRPIAQFHEKSPYSERSHCRTKQSVRHTQLSTTREATSCADSW